MWMAGLRAGPERRVGRPPWQWREPTRVTHHRNKRWPLVTDTAPRLGVHTGIYHLTVSRQPGSRYLFVIGIAGRLIRLICRLFAGQWAHRAAEDCCHCERTKYCNYRLHHGAIVSEAISASLLATAPVNGSLHEIYAPQIVLHVIGTIQLNWINDANFHHLWRGKLPREPVRFIRLSIESLS